MPKGSTTVEPKDKIFGVRIGVGIVWVGLNAMAGFVNLPYGRYRFERRLVALANPTRWYRARVALGTRLTATEVYVSFRRIFRSWVGNLFNG